MADYKKYNTDGRSSEDRALDKFAEMMIEKINTLQKGINIIKMSDGTTRKVVIK